MTFIRPQLGISNESFLLLMDALVFVFGSSCKVADAASTENEKIKYSCIHKYVGKVSIPDEKNWNLLKNLAVKSGIIRIKDGKMIKTELFRTVELLMDIRKRFGG